MQTCYEWSTSPSFRNNRPNSTAAERHVSPCRNNTTYPLDSPLIPAKVEPSFY